MEEDNNDIKTYSEFLNQKETELRAIEFYKEGDRVKSRVTEVAHLCSTQEITSFCVKWNGKANIYAGIHERTTKGTEGANVLSVKIVPLDIDAIHPKDEPATEEELKAANGVCDEIVEKYKHYGKPMKIMTGNGYQLLWKIKPITINDDNRETVNKKLQAFIRNIIKEFSGERAQIDQIGDLARILKVAGTISVKGEATKERPHRKSVIVEVWGGEHSDQLRDDILMQKTEEPKRIIKPTPNDDRLEEVMKRDKKFKSLYSGEISDYKSRSEAEMALACKCVYYGLDVNSVISSASIGKWNDAPPQYRKLTEQKAYERTDEHFDWGVAKKKLKKNEDEPEGIKKRIHELLLQKNRKLARWETAMKLINNDHFICTRDSSELFYYTDGTYIKYGETYAKERIKEAWDEEGAIGDNNEIIDVMKIKTYVDRDMINKKGFVPLSNGILNIETNEMTEFTPDEYFTYKINVKYDNTATCPEIEKFLAEVLNQEDIPAIYELIGYCLYSGYPIHKAFMFLGEGSNGKSTLIMMMTEFLGKENVSSINLQDIADDRFSTANLFGKLANMYADLPDQSLQSTGRFKMLTGGDKLTANKKWGNFIDFINGAKLIFSANKLPEVKDDTDAFFRRWVILNFPNQFEGDNLDPYKLDKITTETELSGLLNKSLEGLNRLLKNGKFSNDESTAQLRENYKRKSDVICAFVEDLLEVAQDKFITKERLYNTFVEYCRIEKLPVKSKSVFGRELPEHISVLESHPKIAGKQVRSWSGIKFKKNDITDITEDGESFNEKSW